MNKTPGPHVFISRNHCFSVEENTKTLWNLSSSKDCSFYSSNSGKLPEKFKSLSVNTTPNYRKESDGSIQNILNHHGYNCGDEDFPCEDENETDKGPSDYKSQSARIVPKIEIFHERNKEYEVILAEFKCKACSGKADGVCVKCVLGRYCRNCFERLHTNDIKLQREKHSLTFYKKDSKNQTKIELFCKSPHLKASVMMKSSISPLKK